MIVITVIVVVAIVVIIVVILGIVIAVIVVIVIVSVAYAVQATIATRMSTQTAGLVCHLLLSGNVRGRLAHLFLGLGKLFLRLLECGGCLHGLR